MLKERHSGPALSRCECCGIVLDYDYAQFGWGPFLREPDVSTGRLIDTQVPKLPKLEISIFK